LRVAGLLSLNTNEPTSDGPLTCLALLVWFINSPDQLIMKTLICCYAVAGLFGYCLAQQAAESLQQSFTHSGTQSYIRVVH
jgi:hypothetical protein